MQNKQERNNQFKATKHHNDAKRPSSGITVACSLCKKFEVFRIFEHVTIDWFVIGSSNSLICDP